jgi:hypothetical protein
MKSNYFVSCILVLSFIISAHSQENFTVDELDTMQAEMVALRQKAPDLHISVYPIVLNDQAGAKLATGAALLLENAGVRKIDIVDASFFPESADTIAQVARKFQEHVTEHPFTGEYGYFIKFTGTQESGGETFTSVLVNKEGKLVFADYHEKSFFKPKTVLGCVHETVKVFCEEAELGDPEDTSEPHGEWYEHFQKQRNQK